MHRRYSSSSDSSDDSYSSSDSESSEYSTSECESETDKSTTCDTPIGQPITPKPIVLPVSTENTEKNTNNSRQMEDKNTAYCYFYNTTPQDISLGSAIPFTNSTISNGFSLVDPFTIECNVKGIYNLLCTIYSIHPVSCALYVNDILYPGSWFGSEIGAPANGQLLLPLEVGDKLQIINTSSQGGTITISPLGSGGNASVGQNVASILLNQIN